MYVRVVRKQSVLHLDLYRIEDPEELEYLAIRDQFDESTVLLVEWPDRGGGLLPAPDLVLDFGESGAVRFIECRSCSPRGAKLAAPRGHPSPIPRQGESHGPHQDLRHHPA